jgi:hypothetical protein
LFSRKKERDGDRHYRFPLGLLDTSLFTVSLFGLVQFSRWREKIGKNIGRGDIYISGGRPGHASADLRIARLQHQKM